MSNDVQMSNTGGIPPFEEAEENLRNFVSSHGFPTDFLWVFEEDIALSYKNRIYVLPVDADANRRLVRDMYEEHVECSTLGVLFDVLCINLSSKVSCVYCYLPPSCEEAEYRMISGLKFGLLAAEHQPEGRLLPRKGIRRKVFSWLGKYKSDPWLRDLPIRKNQHSENKKSHLV